MPLPTTDVFRKCWQLAEFIKTLERRTKCVQRCAPFFFQLDCSKFFHAQCSNPSLAVVGSSSSSSPNSNPGRHSYSTRLHRRYARKIILFNSQKTKTKDVLGVSGSYLWHLCSTRVSNSTSSTTLVVTNIS